MEPPQRPAGRQAKTPPDLTKEKIMFIKKSELEGIYDRLEKLENYVETYSKVMKYTSDKFNNKLSNLILFTQKAISMGEIEFARSVLYAGFISQYTITYVGKTVVIRRHRTEHCLSLHTDDYSIAIDGGTEIHSNDDEGDIAGLFKFADKTYGAKHLSTIMEKKDKKAKK